MVKHSPKILGKRRKKPPSPPPPPPPRSGQQRLLHEVSVRVSGCHMDCAARETRQVSRDLRLITFASLKFAPRKGTVLFVTQSSNEECLAPVSRNSAEY